MEEDLIEESAFEVEETDQYTQRGSAKSFTNVNNRNAPARQSKSNKKAKKFSRSTSTNRTVISRASTLKQIWLHCIQRRESTWPAIRCKMTLSLVSRVPLPCLSFVCRTTVPSTLLGRGHLSPLSM